MYVSMYVCMYVCVCIYIYIYIYVYPALQGGVPVAPPAGGVPVAPPKGRSQGYTSKGIRPISLLTLWISEGLTRAQYQFKGVEFSCP